MAKEFSIGFIGAGRLAGVLAPMLYKSGYSISFISSSSQESASMLSARIPGAKVSSIEDACADLIFVTTPDYAIADVASKVLAISGEFIVHCSGASSLNKLDDAKNRGYTVGSWHPFQTFNKSTSLEGVTFSIEAESPLKEILHEMTISIGGIPMEIKPEMRSLYHASSVMSCGSLATLIHSSWQTWIAAGLPEEQGLDAILKIAKSTLDAIEQMGYPDALTGPVIRGDRDTVASHLDALQRFQPSLSGLYEQVSLLSIKMAQDHGIAGGLIDWSDLFARNSKEFKCD